MCIRTSRMGVTVRYVTLRYGYVTLRYTLRYGYVTVTLRYGTRYVTVTIRYGSNTTITGETELLIRHFLKRKECTNEWTF